MDLRQGPYEVFSFSCSAVTEWLMLRSIDQENLGSNPVLPCQTLLGQVRFSLSCME